MRGRVREVAWAGARPQVAGTSPQEAATSPLEAATRPSEASARRSVGEAAGDRRQAAVGSGEVVGSELVLGCEVAGARVGGVRLWVLSCGREV
jgi:hypothetical protein